MDEYQFFKEATLHICSTLEIDQAMFNCLKYLNKWMPAELKTNGKVHGTDGAADILGVNASTLRHKMNRLGISYGKKKKSKGE